MARLIFIAAIAILAFLSWRWYQRYRLQSQARKQESQDNPIKAIKRCDYCGVHTPQDKGIAEGEHFFCSSEHQKQYHLEND